MRRQKLCTIWGLARRLKMTAGHPRGWDPRYRGWGVFLKKKIQFFFNFFEFVNRRSPAPLPWASFAASRQMGIIEKPPLR